MKILGGGRYNPRMSYKDKKPTVEGCDHKNRNATKQG
jgi:hypothetical protein